MIIVLTIAVVVLGINCYLQWQAIQQLYKNDIAIDIAILEATEAMLAQHIAEHNKRQGKD